MSEFVEKYILPLLIGGGGFATLCLILVPILLRYVGKLRREVANLKKEQSNTKSIADMMQAFNADIEIIKARADYSDTIKLEIAKSVGEQLAKPVDIMQKQIADMQRQLSVTNENVALFNKSALIAWGSVQERGVGEAIKKVLAEQASQTVLYKQELTIDKLKTMLRTIKQDDAESIIAKVVMEVEANAFAPNENLLNGAAEPHLSAEHNAMHCVNATSLRVQIPSELKADKSKGESDGTNANAQS